MRNKGELFSLWSALSAGRNLKTALIMGLGLIFAARSPAQSPPSTDEFNTTIMQSTYEISGPGTAPNTTSFGTVFLVGVHGDDDAAHTFRPVLVTAKHVLDGIVGDFATVIARRRLPDGTYQTEEYKFRIRFNDAALYVTHDEADVAVMPFNPPKDKDEKIIPLDFLVNDARINRVSLHPGDEVFCLGYPLAISGPGGFPILRSGRIASYPLTPASVVKNNVDGLIYLSWKQRRALLLLLPKSSFGRRRHECGFGCRPLRARLPASAVSFTRI